MNKKSVIQIVVISIAFIASGVVLYKGFFSGSGNAGAPIVPLGIIAGSGTSTVSSENVLPYGPTFDYAKIDDLEKKMHFKFGVISYPVLSTSTEVGKPSAADLMIPPVTPK
jgi:hypothetical protein